MKPIGIRRVGPRADFHFALDGALDAGRARTLDRLLLECQARGAAAVRLDFDNVESIGTLGISVLARWGRVYQETSRRIVVGGLAPDLRAALGACGALLHEANAMPPAGESVAEGPPAAEAPSAPEAGPVTDRASVQSRLKRKVVEFRNLFEITRALNLAQDLEEVLGLLGLNVAGQFGIERLALFVADSNRDGVLEARHVRGFPAEHFREFLIPFHAVGGPESGSGPRSLADLERPADAWEGFEALRQSGFEWLVALWARRDLEAVLLLGARGTRREFDEDERDLLTLLAHQGAVAIANARYRKIQEERNLGLVRGMMALIESRDAYAKGSTERVVRYVTAVARTMNVSREELKPLIYGAVLRDIGMLTVSGLLLKNPAHLSEEEWSLIKQHPLRGAQILEEMNFPRDVIDVVQNHHERWGGEGYPNGIRGSEIPLGARIVSLVDAYVAMTGERPYRRALPYEKARQVIAENWGSPFDPEVVEVFLRVLESVERRSRLRTSPMASGSSASRGEDGPQGEILLPGVVPDDPAGQDPPAPDTTLSAEVRT